MRTRMTSGLEEKKSGWTIDYWRGCAVAAKMADGDYEKDAVSHPLQQSSRR